MKTIKLIIVLAISILTLGLAALVGWSLTNSSVESDKISEVKKKEANKILDKRLKEIYVLTYLDKNPAFTITSLTEGSPHTILSEYAGKVIDYQKNNNKEAVIILNDIRQELLFRNSPGQEFEVLVSDLTVKSGLVFSQDGENIYFSEYDPRLKQDKNKPSSWSIKSYNIDTGTYITIAPGYRPYPIVLDGNSQLLYMTDMGISIRNLDEGYALLGTVGGTQSIKKPTFITKNNQYVLSYNVLLDLYDVYELSIADPLILKPAFVIDVSRVDVVDDSNLYFIDGSTNSVSVYEIKDEPRGIDMYTFKNEKDSLIPYKVINK